MSHLPIPKPLYRSNDLPCMSHALLLLRSTHFILVYERIKSATAVTTRLLIYAMDRCEIPIASDLGFGVGANDTIVDVMGLTIYCNWHRCDRELRCPLRSESRCVHGSGWHVSLPGSDELLIVLVLCLLCFLKM